LSLEDSLVISRDQLIRKITDGPNYQRGTWIHPQLSINLATWVNPMFGVKVTELVMRYATGQITTEESHEAAKIIERERISHVIFRRRHKFRCHV